MYVIKDFHNSIVKKSSLAAGGDIIVTTIAYEEKEALK
jgi:hypothetical protein